MWHCSCTWLHMYMSVTEKMVETWGSASGRDWNNRSTQWDITQLQQIVRRQIKLSWGLLLALLLDLLFFLNGQLVGWTVEHNWPMSQEYLLTGKPSMRRYFHSGGTYMTLGDKPCWFANVKLNSIERAWMLTPFKCLDRLLRSTISQPKILECSDSYQPPSFFTSHTLKETQRNTHSFLLCVHYNVINIINAHLFSEWQKKKNMGQGQYMNKRKEYVDILLILI